MKNYANCTLFNSLEMKVTRLEYGVGMEVRATEKGAPSCRITRPSEPYPAPPPTFVLSLIVRLLFAAH